MDVWLVVVGGWRDALVVEVRGIGIVMRWMGVELERRRSGREVEEDGG